MIVYLDQNKWIQIARVVHGKDRDQSVSVLTAMAEAGTLQLPLSAMHYIETARTSNEGRRERLGTVMWRLSRGQTLLSQREIVIYESEVALSQVFPSIRPRKLALLGIGASHAFGIDYSSHLPPAVRLRFERTLVTGECFNGRRPPHFSSEQHRLAFQKHLSDFRAILEQDLPQERWTDALRAMSLVEVLEPLYQAAALHGISTELLEGLGTERLTRLVDAMPSRQVDIHLHLQVLKNKQYLPKKHDLEDWGALGIAAAYCDAVVCEKHFRDLIARDGFQTKATVLRDLSELLPLVEHTDA